MTQDYGKLPLSFETNQGQTESQVDFVSRGNGHSLFLSANEAVLSLKSPKSEVRSPKSTLTSDAGHRTADSPALRMKLVGAIGTGIAVDTSGNAYVIGQTGASNFPTANAKQAARRGSYDAFITKIAP